MDNDSLFGIISSIFKNLLNKKIGASITIPLEDSPAPKDPTEPKVDMNLYIEIKYNLKRTRFAENGIFGELSKDSDNIRIAYTLEHSYDCKPKLPNGTYTCKKGNHMLHSGPIVAFEVMNVPGHQGILLHPGNTESDSEGCILLGKTEVSNEILQSRKAFDDFMDSMKNVDKFTLVVS